MKKKNREEFTSGAIYETPAVEIIEIENQEYILGGSADFSGKPDEIPGGGFF